MLFLLENTWTIDGEADDIIDFCKKNNYECKILNVQQLYELNSIYFLNNVYFCNTDIVQYHLEQINKKYLVPNTYDIRFNKFYNRIIETLTLNEFASKYNSIEKFIKPYDNNKDFDGRVICNINDFESYGVKIPNLNQKIYCCDPIKIISEVRLLIGNNKLYGHGHICKNRISNYIEDKIFIEELIKASNYDYLCIDIGYVFDEKNKVFKWIVIEINPPFSLDDHEINFQDYMYFCIDACNYLNKKINTI